MSFRVFSTIVAIFSVSALAVAGHYELKPTNQNFPKNPYGGLYHWDENQYYAYSNATDGSGYGAVDSWYDYNECEGEITTVYVWVRDKLPGTQTDDPLDDPPTEVIKAEYCKASALSISVFGPGLALSNNGLGFQATLGGDEHSAWSYSEGTLYTKIAGEETIVVTRSPSALAEGLGTDCFVGVRYKSTIIVPTVALSGTTRFYNPNQIAFLTGQQITPSISLQNASSIASPGIKTYLWSVKGGDDIVYFKDFQFSSAPGGREMWDKDPQAPEYRQPTFPFFSAENGDAEVLCTVELKKPPGDPNLFKFAWEPATMDLYSKDITSVRPELGSWDIVEGDVQITTELAYHASTSTGAAKHGQDWLNVKINAPALFGEVGQGAFCQLFNGDRHLFRVPAQGYYSEYEKDPNAVEMLDIACPTPAPYGMIWSLTGKGKGYDSPSNPLSLPASIAPGNNLWNKSTAADTLRTWVIYLPPPAFTGQKTTWIPIEMYTWSWDGVAQNSNPPSFSWSITSSSKSTGHHARTTDHPGWPSISPPGSQWSWNGK